MPFWFSRPATRSWVGPRGTGPNLRICRDKSQVRGPSGLPSRARPAAQIGLRSDLEMARAEVATKSFCRNVSALRNRISHQVDADGEHHGSGWKVDGGKLFPGRNYGAALACARTTPGALTSSFEPPSYPPTLTTITCARRGACSCCSSASSVARVPQDCSLLLRLPASQSEQATARSVAAGHVDGQEAACRGQS